MAKETLQQHLNRKLKEKGTSLTDEKKKAGKYKSISAAQKAGSLYYTDKNGKVMAAVFAGDLKEKTTKPPVRPKTRPPVKKPKAYSGRGGGAAEVKKRKTDIESPTMKAKRREKAKKGYQTLGDMRAGGSRVPRLMPKGRAAVKEIKAAGQEELDARASRAKRYTKDQWDSMSRGRRIELGLPVSAKEVRGGNATFKGQTKRSADPSGLFKPKNRN